VRIQRTSILPTVIALSLCVILAVPQPQPATAQVAGALSAVTIASFLQGLTEVIQQLETSAHSLIDQGNIALGQQQMLLAGILQQTLQQISATYAGALNTTFGQLSIAEQNTFSQLYDTINKTKDLEKDTASDVQAIVYQTQGAANQLLDRLPFTNKYPVFYGASVRDLTTSPGQQPSDIEFLGFHWIDPQIGKNPVVTVAGDLVPANLVSIREDRLEVQIPDVTKQKIGFGNQPCDPRKTFPMEVKVFGGVRRGIWPISWTSQREYDFNANALPGPQLYTLKVTYSGARQTQALQTQNYTQKSGYVAMGCEETTSTSVRFQAPANAQEIQCSASWVDAVAVKNSSQNCAVGGTVVTATGSITGRDRQCYVIGGLFGRKNGCNCPGGGHGWLQISGTYKVPTTTIEQINNAVVGTYTIPQGSGASVALPADTSVTVKAIDVQISRKSCQKQYDDIGINAPALPLQHVDQNSENGSFKSSYWNGQLTVTSTQ
jgi:hypothetical protein